MKYLLSDLTITESVLDYVTDMIKVYFSLDKLDVPSMDIGIDQRIPESVSLIAYDKITTEVSEFINVVGGYGIKLSNPKVVSDGSTFNISFDLDNEPIKFRLT